MPGSLRQRLAQVEDRLVDDREILVDRLQGGRRKLARAARRPKPTTLPWPAGSRPRPAGSRRARDRAGLPRRKPALRCRRSRPPLHSPESRRPGRRPSPARWRRRRSPPLRGPRRAGARPPGGAGMGPRGAAGSRLGPPAAPSRAAMPGHKSREGASSRGNAASRAGELRARPAFAVVRIRGSCRHIPKPPAAVAARGGAEPCWCRPRGRWPRRSRRVGSPRYRRARKRCAPLWAAGRSPARGRSRYRRLGWPGLPGSKPSNSSSGKTRCR